MSRRIRAGLDELCTRHHRGDFVVVTHAEIIRGALLLAESRSWSSWSLYRPEPVSITPVRWEPMEISGQPA